MKEGAEDCFGCWLAGMREDAREEALEEVAAGVEDKFSGCAGIAEYIRALKQRNK